VVSHEKIDVVCPVERVLVVGLIMVVAPAKCSILEDFGRLLQQCQWALTFTLLF
jgi:hypothetical protein